MTNMTISEFKELIYSKLGYHVNLKLDYKICDLKPTYAKLFEDYIRL